MVKELKVTLEQTEYSGLLEVALSELRDPASQLRYILRQELYHRGLLPIPTKPVGLDNAQVQGDSAAAPTGY